MRDIRTFLDDNGVRWEVREIGDPAFAIVPTRYLRRPEYADGWLLFTTDDGQRRRLAPYPRDWHGSSDGELRSMCRDALVVGLLSGPPGPGAHELQG
jgi:hypothetical protein